MERVLKNKLRVNYKIKVMQIKKFLISVGFFATIAGLSAVVMLLWNWLMPAIFGLDTINFWQILIILILSCFILWQIFSDLEALMIEVPSDENNIRRKKNSN